MNGLKGVTSAKRYTAADKAAVLKLLGLNPTVQKIFGAKGKSRILDKDLETAHSFSRYLSEAFMKSVLDVKKELQLSDPNGVAMRTVESVALDLRNMYMCAVTEALVKRDGSDVVLEKIKGFSPRKPESLEWLRGIKLPVGAPSVSVLTESVRRPGEVYLGGKVPVRVQIKPEIISNVTKRHWPLASCPLGFGAVSMMVAATVVEKKNSK